MSLDLRRPVLVRRVYDYLEARHHLAGAQAIAELCESNRVSEIYEVLSGHDHGDCSNAQFCTHELWQIASEVVDAARGTG